MGVWYGVCYIDSQNLKTDKAKPRVIVGRKATGPSGIARLPKLKMVRTIPDYPWLGTPRMDSPVFYCAEEKRKGYHASLGRETNKRERGVTWRHRMQKS